VDWRRLTDEAELRWGALPAVLEAWQAGSDAEHPAFLVKRGDLWTLATPGYQAEAGRHSSKGLGISLGAQRRGRAGASKKKQAPAQCGAEEEVGCGPPRPGLW